MTKQRSRTRQARLELINAMHESYDGHDCEQFQISRNTNCLLCNAWQKALPFVVYEMLSRADLVSPRVTKLYETFCGCFGTERISDLIEREKHKMLNLPWVSCQGCRTMSPVSTWYPAFGGADRQTCPNCGHVHTFDEKFLIKLYIKQKRLFNKEREHRG